MSEVGPVLMARLLQLNETQEGVLNIVFRIAASRACCCSTSRTCRPLLQWVAENAGSLTTENSAMSASSRSEPFQRQLLTLSQQGGEGFFGEPALVLTDMIRCDPSAMAPSTSWRPTG